MAVYLQGVTAIWLYTVAQAFACKTYTCQEKLDKTLHISFLYEYIQERGKNQWTQNCKDLWSSKLNLRKMKPQKALFSLQELCQENIMVL